MRGVGDLVRSLVVILGIVAVVLLLAPRPSADPVRVIDWRPAYGQAQAAATYPVLAPVALPDRWRATSARTTGTAGDGSAAWQLGFVTPAGEFAALAQSDGDTERFVSDLTRDGTTKGVVRIGDRAWEQTLRRRGEEDYRALVAPVEGSVVVVAGTASYPELAELAGALSPPPAR